MVAAVGFVLFGAPALLFGGFLFVLAVAMLTYGRSQFWLFVFAATTVAVGAMCLIAAIESWTRRPFRVNVIPWIVVGLFALIGSAIAMVQAGMSNVY